MKIDADGAWKDVCREKLELVFALLWKPIYDSVNWSVDNDTVDPELRKLTADVLVGNRIADCFIKVTDKLTGDLRYFLMEVQGKKEPEFPRRVHICNARAEERFAVHITSLVVLTDTNPKWRPNRYVSGCFPIEEPADAEQTSAEQTSAEQPPQEKKKKKRKRYHDERTLRFMMVKLIDFEGREVELEADENPFGLFLVAHLTAIRNRKNAKKRALVKLRLLLNLRQRKMTAADVQFWERCFDRLLPLPAASNREIWEQLQLLDTEQSMTFVSFAEQSGIDKGLKKGLEQGLEKGLEQGLEKGLEQGLEKGQRMGLLKAIRLGLKLRFQDAGLALASQIESVSDIATLETIYAAIDADTPLNEIRKLVPASTNGQADSHAS